MIFKDTLEKIDFRTFLKKKFLPEGGRAAYFYTHYFCCAQYGFTHPIYPHTGFIAGVMKNHLVKWNFFADSKDLQFIFDRFYNNLEELEALELYLNKTREDGINKIKIVNEKKISKIDLKRLFGFYFEYYWHLMVTAGTLRMLDRAVIANLKDYFADRPDMENVIATASLQTKVTFSTSEELAVLRLADKLVSGKIKKESTDFKIGIDKLVEDFSFYVLGYFDETPRDRIYYERSVSEVMDNNPGERINKILKNISLNVANHNKLFSSLDDRGKRLVRIASMAPYLKDLYKYSINKLEYYGEPLFIEIAKHSGEKISFIKDMHPNEILNLVDGNKPDRKIVEDRAKYNVILGVPGKMEILLKKEAENFENKCIPKIINRTEFVGRIASKGYAKGKARIVLSVSDFEKLEDGNILVVTNTSPDFLPILKKASAIVAEDGGLTAHVSIISREFGIPCVVGIFNATDIIKDNELVEVDAERGVVRILKKNEELRIVDEK